MRINPEHYRAAAKERVEAAKAEYLAGRYAGSVYLAGLAVESMLRAYRCRNNPEFDSRHDLADLLKSSAFEGFVPRKRRAEVAASLGEVWMRWKNDYRFAANDRLTAAFRDLRLFEGVDGDGLKANARIVLDNSLSLVGIGDARWKMTSKTE